MKKFKLGSRILSCVLAFSMILGTCTTAFAAAPTPEAIKYVSLGDSMTNGYGLPDYEEVNPDGTITNWFGFQRNDVEGSYPWKVAANYGWTLSQLATSGLRADDVYYLLNLGTDYEVNWDEYGRRHMPEKFKQSYEELFGAGSDDEIIAYAAEIYQEEVKDADVISVGIGSNNFATLMDLRMMWWMGRILGDESMFAGGGYNGPFDFNELVADLTAEEKAEIEELYVKAEQMLKDAAAEAGIPLEAPLTADGAAMGDLVEDMANAIAYTTAGFAFGYKGIVDTIIRENNDAEIIIVGLTNWFRGMVYGVPVGDKVFEFPMGDLMDVVCDFAGVYMAALPAAYKAEAQINGTDIQPIYFADTNADGVGNVELIVDVIVENTADVDLDSLDEFELGSNERFEAAKAIAQNITSAAIPDGTTRARLLEAMSSYVLSMMSGLGIATPKLNQVELFEAWVADGMSYSAESFVNFAMSLPSGNNPLMGGDPTPYVMGCIAYLGLEKSMISSLHLDVVNVEHFQVLSSVENLMNVTMGALDGHMTADPNDIAGALIAVPELGTISNLMFNFLVGSGVIVHPSDDGHSTIANVIIDAYDRNWTATDETIDNLKKAAELTADLIAEYYDEAYAYAYAEADKAGYIDFAAGAIDNAIAAIYALDLSGVEMTAELEAKLEIELAAVVATLVEVKGILAEDKASDVEGLVESVNGLWDDLNTHLVNAGAILAQAEYDVKTLVVPVVKAYVDAYVGIAKGIIEDSKDAVIGGVNKALANAVHKHYSKTEDSYYVALGGYTVWGNGINRDNKYYRLIADNYGIDKKNIYKEGILLPDEALTLIAENASEIANADLITYQLDATSFIWATMFEDADWDKYINEYLTAEQRALVEEIVDETIRVLTMDWEAHTDAQITELVAKIKVAVMSKLPEDVPFVENIFDSLVEFLLPYIQDEIIKAEGIVNEKLGIDEKIDKIQGINNAINSLDETTKEYIEKFAFAFVSYAIETAKAVEAINMINPDATLVVVGMYNPFRGLEIKIGEDAIDVEEYFEYVIKATNTYYTALAAVNGDFAFVDVAEAETDGLNISINVADTSQIISTLAPMLNSVIKNMHANVDGHEYIAGQVVKALTCVYNKYVAVDEDNHAVMCAICDYVLKNEAHDGDPCSLCGYTKPVVPEEDEEEDDEPKRTSGSSSSSGQFVVKFDTNGGSAVASVVVKKDALLAEPAAPTKEGFVFDGWYTDKALTAKYDFSTPVTKSFTLYAKWMNAVLAKFTDLDKAAWYYEYVMTVVEKGLMNGVSETKFAPEGTLTRGMFVTILHRVEGEPVAETGVEFADVAADQYYANAVKWANANGIVNGVSETEFAPNAEVTREQMAAMLARYADYKKLEAAAEGEVTYTDDAEISEYAKDAVKVANKLGILIGNADGSFAPKKNATRAEAATLFARLLGVLEK